MTFSASRTRCAKTASALRSPTFERSGSASFGLPVVCLKGPAPLCLLKGRISSGETLGNRRGLVSDDAEISLSLPVFLLALSLSAAAPDQEQRGQEP